MLKILGFELMDKVDLHGASSFHSKADFEDLSFESK